MKKLFYTVFFLIILNFTGLAHSKVDVKDFLKSKIDSAIIILADKNINNKVKKERIAALVDTVINFDLIAKLTLKDYWHKISRQDKEKFNRLFKDFLYSTYLKELPFYSNQKIIYKPVIKKSSKKAYVPTVIAGKTDKFSVLYKLYNSRGKDWKIYDIEIQGVSIVMSYKKQFDSVLKSGTMNDLFKKLRSVNTKK